MSEPLPPLVLVDATNVLRSKVWQIVVEGLDDAAAVRRLVDAAASWCAGEGVHGRMVFDGGPVAVTGTPACEVVASGNRTADDVLERCASEARAGGREVWVVSSDRAVMDVAGAHAKRRFAAGEFAGLISDPGPAAAPDVGAPAHPGATRLGEAMDDAVRDALERIRRGE